MIQCDYIYAKNNVPSFIKNDERLTNGTKIFITQIANRCLDLGFTLATCKQFADQRSCSMRKIVKYLDLSLKTEYIELLAGENNSLIIAIKNIDPFLNHDSID